MSAISPQSKNSGQSLPWTELKLDVSGIIENTPNWYGNTHFKLLGIIGQELDFLNQFEWHFKFTMTDNIVDLLRVKIAPNHHCIMSLIDRLQINLNKSTLGQISAHPLNIETAFAGTMMFDTTLIQTTIEIWKTWSQAFADIAFRNPSLPLSEFTDLAFSFVTFFESGDENQFNVWLKKHSNNHLDLLTIVKNSLRQINYFYPECTNEIYRKQAYGAAHLLENTIHVLGGPNLNYRPSTQ